MELYIKNIALLNIKNKGLRSLILIALMGILSSSVFISIYTVLSLKNGINSLKDRLGADIIIVPEGIEKKLEGALFNGTPESFYLDREVMNAIPLDSIEAMSPQLYIATLTIGCCSFPLQAIGIDFETDFIVKPWLTKTIQLPLKKDEVVIGSNIMAKEGDILTFFNHEYKVKAKLSSTGMGFDNSVFLSLYDARKMAEYASKVTAIPTIENDRLISNVLIKVKDIKPRDLLIQLKKYVKKYGATAFVAANMLSEISAKLKNLFTYIYILLFVLCFLGIAIIGLTFFLNISERSKEYSSIRAIGATKSYLYKLVILESSLLVVLGSACGIVLGGTISLLFNTALKQTFRLPFLMPQFKTLIILGLGNILVALIIGVCSSFLIMKIITKKEIAIAVKQNN
ncbi:ABC transporter permease [Treponema denticola]|uniref:ABC transporter permease n=1 Tax=Treponema denticola TaxID=158 RepID=UPI0020A4C833|nr:ABC transporter permease [Treponema denticola]UTC83664.1 ABC transporter permease [Treponema denticola]